YQLAASDRIIAAHRSVLPYPRHWRKYRRLAHDPAALPLALAIRFRYPRSARCLAPERDVDDHNLSGGTEGSNLLSSSGESCKPPVPQLRSRRSATTKSAALSKAARNSPGSRGSDYRPGQRCKPPRDGAAAKSGSSPATSRVTHACQLRLDLPQLHSIGRAGQQNSMFARHRSWTKGRGRNPVRGPPCSLILELSATNRL